VSYWCLAYHELFITYFLRKFASMLRSVLKNLFENNYANLSPACTCSIPWVLLVKSKQSICQEIAIWIFELEKPL
jgi:hypothetical protein